MRISDWSSDVCSSDLEFWLMDETVAARIKQEIDDNQVVLFMKGTPVFPQCGFSAAVVQILSHLNVKFKGVDVLQDLGIRQGIKDFSNWPTIPQLRSEAHTSELQSLMRIPSVVCCSKTKN